jgi:hypothetical protein
VTDERPPDSSTKLEPDIHGAEPIYVCSCYHAHGVAHLCSFCRRFTAGWLPSEAWVPGERCYTCLHDEEARLRAALNWVEAKLRKAVHAVDPTTGQRIPPKFLTPQGWMD